MHRHAPIKNFINGQFVPPLSGEWIDNIDPAHGEVCGQVASSNAADIEQAVGAATAASPSWANSTAEHRAAILERIAAGIEIRLDEFAKAESEDCGKPITRACKIEIPRAATNFRFFASAIMQFSSELHDSLGQTAINMTLRQPLGVVACISPWNLPLYLFSWKVAPAIATGNCVVAKPSELTPRTAALLGEVCQAAGLPPGVLNIVQGTGASAGQAMLEHPGIKAVSFTGGSETGRHVARVVAPQLKKYSLELGGKNPNLVFADCDYETMLATSVMAAFSNQGQICLCGSRILVQQEIYERFKQDFVARVAALRVGDPSDTETQIGAVISKVHLEKISQYLEQAAAGSQGERVLCGGHPVHPVGCESGYFVQPTVIEVESNECRLNQEEIFGPVVTLMPFASEAEAVQLANGVPYGLSATVWSRDLDRVMRVSRSLESGVVWVNTWLMRDLRTPFGGMKASGVGREGGLDSMRFFTEAKNICIAYQATPDQVD